MSTSRPTDRISAWLVRWRPVLPLLLAELIVWIGFGALLPVLPLYFTEQGVDLTTLGLVTAAWPAARLVGEPVFGWLADRTARVPLMVFGLVATGVFLALPLFVKGALAFLVLRGLAGLATAVYDPAARGLIIDATPRERHGEAFGLYSAAQMGGILLGPAIGGLGGSAFGGIAFFFIFGSLTAFVAAAAVALGVREVPRQAHVPALSPTALTDLRRDLGRFDDPVPEAGEGESGTAPSPGSIRRASRPPPASLRNRILVAAVVANVGGFFGAGTYDVIWSLFLTARGASLTIVGLTFMFFGLPVLVFAPIAGRLVDRRGRLPFVIAGSVVVAIASTLYTFIGDGSAAWAIPIIVFEATGFAFLNPALYAIVGQGSPAGRSSTAQGIFGSAGTLGFVISAVVTGALAAVDLRYPFYLFSTVMVVSLGLTLAIGGRAIRAGDRMTSDADSDAQSAAGHATDALGAGHEAEAVRAPEAEARAGD
jgi:MFS family permease